MLYVIFDSLSCTCNSQGLFSHSWDELRGWQLKIRRFQAKMSIFWEITPKWWRTFFRAISRDIEQFLGKRFFVAKRSWNVISSDFTCFWAFCEKIFFYVKWSESVFSHYFTWFWALWEWKIFLSQKCRRTCFWVILRVFQLFCSYKIENCEIDREWMSFGRRHLSKEFACSLK